MAAEKFPSPPVDWSWSNPRWADQLRAFRARYPLYARAFDDGADPADREAMEAAWLRWVTGRESGRR